LIAKKTENPEVCLNYFVMCVNCKKELKIEAADWYKRKPHCLECIQK